MGFLGGLAALVTRSVRKNKVSLLTNSFGADDTIFADDTTHSGKDNETTAPVKANDTTAFSKAGAIAMDAAALVAKNLVRAFGFSVAGLAIKLLIFPNEREQQFVTWSPHH